MIIKIEQTKANLGNKFEIKVNNALRYLAGTPWMDINLPLDIDRTRKCIITEADGNLCYITSYDVVENIVNTAIPMKWVFTGQQKSYIFNIYDNQNNLCGKFYKLINGFFDTKYIIEYGNYMLKCYDKCVGKTRNISIYLNDIQIAEIVKPLCVSNNLDNYYLFLLDEYANLETILSFFTIFFDYHNYSNSGQVVGYKRDISVAYTYDKNNKFYDKNWVLSHFNKEEVALICNQILENRENVFKDIKKFSKGVILFVVLTWVIILIIFIILNCT